MRVITRVNAHFYRINKVRGENTIIILEKNPKKGILITKYNIQIQCHHIANGVSHIFAKAFAVCAETSSNLQRATQPT